MNVWVPKTLATVRGPGFLAGRTSSGRDGRFGPQAVRLLYLTRKPMFAGRARRRTSLGRSWPDDGGYDNDGSVRIADLHPDIVGPGRRQDVEPAEGSDGTDGRWRIARKVAEDRVVYTVDPGARHTHKSPEARRDSYRAHVAAGPETGIITDEQQSKAAGQENSDPALAEKFLAREDADDDTDGAGAAGQAGPDAAGSQHSAGDRDGGGRLAWYGDSA